MTHNQVKPTLKAIGQELKPGCVVLDTSFLKQPVIEWSESYLGEAVTMSEHMLQGAVLAEAVKYMDGLELIRLNRAD